MNLYPEMASHKSKMTKTNTENIVKQWLDDIYISRTVEYRRFYNVESLYNMYKGSLFFHKPKSDGKKIYILRAFTRILNNIIASKSVSTFISSKVITPTILRSTTLRSTDNST